MKIIYSLRIINFSKNIFFVKPFKILDFLGNYLKEATLVC